MSTAASRRVIKVLLTITSVVYFGTWAGSALILAGLPAAKLFGAGPNMQISMEVPAKVDRPLATVQTRWGAGSLEIDDVQAQLKLPIAMLPWWFVGLFTAYCAVTFALFLLAAYQLRRIFQRVKAGSPFDASNARRLRHLGVILIGLAVFEGVSGFVTALAVRRGLVESIVMVPRRLHVDASTIFVGLVLIALAEVFRHGAELETEQSLVV